MIWQSVCWRDHQLYQTLGCLQEPSQLAQQSIWLVRPDLHPTFLCASGCFTPVRSTDKVEGSHKVVISRIPYTYTAAERVVYVKLCVLCVTYDQVIANQVIILKIHNSITLTGAYGRIDSILI